MQMIPMTQAGKDKLEAQLEHLKKVERPQITEAIASARELGDLKENAEYHAAKEEQGLNEKRIQELETSIALAEVIDITKIKADDKVIFASTIIVQDLETEKKNTYKIVGRDEADVKNGLIFFGSPLGKGFIGKNKGDLVSIETPSGEKSFEILDVKYI